MNFQFELAVVKGNLMSSRVNFDSCSSIMCQRGGSGAAADEDGVFGESPYWRKLGENEKLNRASLAPLRWTL